MKKYAKEIGEVQAFSMLSFRSRGAMSRAFSRCVVGDHYAQDILENPNTSWRYVRLLDVLAPGSGGEGMVSGISETQYPDFNQFPLSVIRGQPSETNLTKTKTNPVNPYSSSMGWVRPSYALGRTSPGPDLEGQEVREGWNHQPREVRPLGGVFTLLKRRTDSNYTVVLSVTRTGARNDIRIP